jgi:hypothetical protein
MYLTTHVIILNDNVPGNDVSLVYLISNLSILHIILFRNYFVSEKLANGDNSCDIILY